MGVERNGRSGSARSRTDRTVIHSNAKAGDERYGIVWCREDSIGNVWQERKKPPGRQAWFLPRGTNNIGERELNVALIIRMIQEKHER